MQSITSHDQILVDLIHDLRQRFGNMETSLFYLDLVLNHPSGPVREQLRTMEIQVAQAAQLLHRATEQLHVSRDQRAAAGASLPLTKPVTAGVA